jgi:hypothetical protein
MPDRGTAAIERPRAAGARSNTPEFGSDAVAETLRALEIPYIAINPGASFRGLHDSLVNYLGNDKPQLLLCLHEEAAVAIAHGYAKVTGRAMAAAVHSNVGLFHATMAMFNAWCDRMPVLVIGATGPVDAAKRRPWIDWIHTARDQGAIVRGYTKWDDQPGSAEAAREAVARAFWIANATPKGPTYVVLDAGLQEERMTAPLAPFDVRRSTPPVATGAASETIDRVRAMLDQGRRIVMLSGRASRSMDAWAARIALAERLDARVVTDLKTGASFPTDHPRHVGAPAILAPARSAGRHRRGRRDPEPRLGRSRQARSAACRAPEGASDPRLARPRRAQRLEHGLPRPGAVDLYVAADPDAVAMALSKAIEQRPASRAAVPASEPTPPTASGPLRVEHLAFALREAVGTRDVSLLHLPLSWNGAWWPFRHPLDFIGGDGGGGVGGGPASRWVPRSRSKAAIACLSRSAETATF